MARVCDAGTAILSRDRQGAVVKYAVLSCIFLLLAGCGAKPITTDFDKLSQDVIYGSTVSGGSTDGGTVFSLVP